VGRAGSPLGGPAWAPVVWSADSGRCRIC